MLECARRVTRHTRRRPERALHSALGRALLGLCGAALLLASCAPNPQAGSTSEGAAAPSAGTSARTLRIGLLEEPLQFGLGFVGISNTGVSELMFAFMAGLTVFDAAGVNQPRLAQKVPRVEDGDWTVAP